MRLVDGRTGIEVINRDACMRLLASRSLGRVAALVGGRPICLPVNYALDEDRVVFRTASGTKLDAAVRGAPVAFEIDDADPTNQTAWSVMVSGTAEEVLHHDEIARLEALPLRPWAPGDKSHWVVIHPDTISGRRVGPAS